MPSGSNDLRSHLCSFLAVDRRRPSPRGHPSTGLRLDPDAAHKRGRSAGGVESMDVGASPTVTSMDRGREARKSRHAPVAGNGYRSRRHSQEPSEGTAKRSEGILTIVTPTGRRKHLATVWSASGIEGRAGPMPRQSCNDHAESTKLKFNARFRARGVQHRGARNLRVDFDRRKVGRHPRRRAYLGAF